MKKIAIGLSAATLAMAGTAYAAHHGGMHNPDTDGDSVITRAEHQAHASAMFAMLDANDDGKLDQADREAHREAMRSRMFETLDADGNGSISRDEFMSHKPHHKGRHGQGEHAMGGHAMGEHGQGGPGMEGHGKDGMGKQHHMGMRGHHGGPMQMMKMADTDNDGAVTEVEFTAAADKRFAKIDANGDGQVTKEERQAHREEMRSKWRERAGS